MPTILVNTLTEIDVAGDANDPVITIGNHSGLSEEEILKLTDTLRDSFKVIKNIPANLYIRIRT